MRLELHLDASPQRVWAAIASAELADWYWPTSLEPVVEIDPRVGGRFSLRSEPGGLAVTGEVTEADAPRRLAYSWRWAGDDHESHVTLTLHESEGGTDLVVEHLGLSRPDELTSITDGWTSCLGRLPGHLSASAG